MFTAIPIMDEPSVNHISLNIKAGLDVIAMSPTAQDACWPIPGWGDRVMGTVISSTKYSQVAGLIHTTGRKSSNVTSFCAAVFEICYCNVNVVGCLQ